MSYGHQHEAAAEALRQLLTADTLPIAIDWSPCETSSARHDVVCLAGSHG